MSTLQSSPSSALPAMGRVAVFGGYGTFGRIVARELASRGLQVTVVGRDASRAEAYAAELGTTHVGASADVRSADDCAQVIAGHHVAVHCAGPFSGFDAKLLKACCGQNCHYVDIADDRAYCKMVQSHGDAFAAKRLTAAYGCSSLPGISLAASMLAAQQRDDPPQRARVTLFIGNNNPKGQGAVASASQLVGRGWMRHKARCEAFASGNVYRYQRRLGRAASSISNRPTTICCRSVWALITCE